MSRIILERYRSGEERFVVGWDRPQATFYFQWFREDPEDDQDPLIDSSGNRINEHYTLGDLMNHMPWPIYNEITPKVKRLLEIHRELDYPESNVVIDRKEIA